MSGTVAYGYPTQSAGKGYLTAEQVATIELARASLPRGTTYKRYAEFCGWTESQVSYRFELYDRGRIKRTREAKHTAFLTFRCGVCAAECVDHRAYAGPLLCSTCRAERIERLIAERRRAS